MFNHAPPCIDADASKRRRVNCKSDMDYFKASMEKLETKNILTLVLWAIDKGNFKPWDNFAKELIIFNSILVDLQPANQLDVGH